MNIKEKVKEIKQNLTALYIAIKKKETPWYAKVAAGITVAYALSPIDLVPDFIPVLGYLDDLIILPLLILLAVRLIPENIMEQARVEAQDLWKSGKPKKWYYGLPIICIWLLLAAIMLKAIFWA